MHSKLPGASRAVIWFRSVTSGGYTGAFPPMCPSSRRPSAPSFLLPTSTPNCVCLLSLVLFNVLFISLSDANPALGFGITFRASWTSHSFAEPILSTVSPRATFGRSLRMASDAKPNLGQQPADEKRDVLAPLVGKAREFKIKQEPVPGQVFQSGVGVAVFVTNPKYPGAILLGKRKGSTGAGTWALPGGHLDFGESFEECAKRETKEEAALSLTNVRFSTVNNAIDLAARYHYVVIFMAAETEEEPTNLEENKCEGWYWIKWDAPDFPSPLFTALDNVRREGFNPLAS